jgi:hypothetical protein
MKTIRWPILAAALLLLTFGAAAGEGEAQTPPSDKIPEPGYLEVLQMTAVELDGRLPGSVDPVSFAWSIVEGEGGKLFDTDKPDAVFLGPKVETGTLDFLIELTVTYREQPPSTRRVRIRVLSEEAAKAAEGSADDTQWLEDYYRGLREREEEKKASQPRLVVPNTGPTTSMSVGVHRGWGGGWGGSVGFRWTMSYPITQPVDVPPPGETHDPGQGLWDIARPVPYEELGTTFPSSIADRYSPADHPDSDDGNDQPEPEKSEEDR